MADEQMVAALLPSISSSGSMESQGRGYYRSKLFSVHDELSPFVSAASPLFSLLDRFVVAENLPPIERVMINLDHELKAFHSRLLSQPYSEMQNALAYYLLAATVDEVLARSYLRLFGRAPAFKAFTPATYTEEEPGTKFFSILMVLKSRPFEHLPLLELAYYCLMAGFEGEQHGRADGRQVLEAEIDGIFRLITQYRQQTQLVLFERPKAMPTALQPYRRLAGAGMGMVCLFVFCIFLSQFFLEHQANRLRFTPTFITALDE
jgi:type VI secretion system protein ImpK